MVTIADPLVYITQGRCADGSAPLSCETPAPQQASDPVYYRRFDQDPSSSCPGGCQAQDDVLAPGGDVIHAATFAPPSSADGGDLLRVTGDTVAAYATKDVSTRGLLYFLGPDCGAGWVMFKTDAPTGSWREMVVKLNGAASASDCPTSFNQAFTRYRAETVTFAFHDLTTGAARPAPIRTVVSEHYDNARVAAASMMERFYFGERWGKLRWERWSAPGTPQPYPAPGLPERCPAVDHSIPPADGWTLADCRQWTRLSREPGNWRVGNLAFSGLAR